jgi:hypothetical protein
MNLFVLFGDGAITRKIKKTETLRKCLKNARKMTSAMRMEQRAVMYFLRSACENANRDQKMMEGSEKY